jgi:hypothetical protein
MVRMTQLQAMPPVPFARQRRMPCNEWIEVMKVGYNTLNAMMLMKGPLTLPSKHGADA